MRRSVLGPAPGFRRRQPRFGPSPIANANAPLRERSHCDQEGDGLGRDAANFAQRKRDSCFLDRLKRQQYDLRRGYMPDCRLWATFGLHRRLSRKSQVSWRLLSEAKKSRWKTDDFRSRLLGARAGMQRLRLVGPIQREAEFGHKPSFASRAKFRAHRAVEWQVSGDLSTRRGGSTRLGADVQPCDAKRTLSR